MISILTGGIATTVARYVAAMLGAILVKQGLADEATAQALVGGVIALGSVLIGALASRTVARVATVADMPGLTVVDARGMRLRSAADVTRMGVVRSDDAWHDTPERDG